MNKISAVIKAGRHRWVLLSGKWVSLAFIRKHSMQLFNVRFKRNQSIRFFFVPSEMNRTIYTVGCCLCIAFVLFLMFILLMRSMLLLFFTFSFVSLHSVIKIFSERFCANLEIDAPNGHLRCDLWFFFWIHLCIGSRVMLWQWKKRKKREK